jgi:3-oxoacyl-(acyl-carrier-protein) synthase
MNPVAVRAWSMITPLGTEGETLAALFEGRSGFSSQLSPHPLRNGLAACIPNRPAHAETPKAWQQHLAVTVGKTALTKAGVDVRSLTGRIAFVFATSYGHLLDEPGDDTMSTWAVECTRSLGSDAEPIVVGSACSSSADAIGLAAALLDTDMADLAIVIAVDH